MNLSPVPDALDIAQAEEEGYEVGPTPVSVCGPVESREVPAKQGGYTTYTGVTTSGTQALSFEPRRKSATIIGHDQAIWIGSSQQSAATGGYAAFKAPVGVPITVDHMDEVWVAPVTDTSDISVMTSFWSE